MNLLRLLPFLCLFISATHAQSAFPGLQKVMTEAEWKRAGLDRLTPDQIGVIDAALIRHTIRTATEPPPAAPVIPADATPAQAAVAKARFWEKFGLGKSNGNDWRNQPPMTAKVTGMRGANGFSLDNGQIWEGQEMIPYEIIGQTVTIEARPLGAYALKLNEESVAVRVRRLR